MTSLDVLLPQIEGELLRLEGEVALDFWRPGLERSRVVSDLTAQGLSARDELVDLWSWRNGSLSLPGLRRSDQVFCGYYVLSLLEALQERSGLLAMPPGMGLGFSSEWIPILSDSAGTFVVLDTSDGSVLNWDCERTDVPVLFASFADLVAVTLKVLRAGSLFSEGEYGPQFEFGTFYSAAADMYPSMDYLQDLAGRQGLARPLKMGEVMTPVYSIERSSDLGVALARVESLFIEMAGENAMALLDEGLPAMAVGAALGEVTPRLELCTFWSWRNGGPGVIPGFPITTYFCGMNMPSVQQALSIRRSFLRARGRFTTEFPEYDPAWIPVLASGDCDFLIHDGPGGGVLRWYSRSAPDVPEVFPSLDEMVATTLAGLEAGILYAQADGQFIFDSAAFFELAATRYPHLPQLVRWAADGEAT
jgi:hypothetical protein